MSHAAPSHVRMRGTLISTPIDSDKVVQRDCVQCVHCSRVWLWEPGSGRRRGYCLRCNGITCGRPLCDNACMPILQMIENMEAGRPWDWRPVTVYVGG